MVNFSVQEESVMMMMMMIVYVIDVKGKKLVKSVDLMDRHTQTVAMLYIVLGGLQ